MRIKIYRKSAPNMEPLVSDNIDDTSLEQIHNTLVRIRDYPLHKFFVNRTLTYASTDDISYIQIVED